MAPKRMAAPRASDPDEWTYAKASRWYYDMSSRKFYKEWATTYYDLRWDPINYVHVPVAWYLEDIIWRKGTVQEKWSWDYVHQDSNKRRRRRASD
eukprot:4556642-Pyramimonas_sp.AAC.1